MTDWLNRTDFLALEDEDFLDLRENRDKIDPLGEIGIEGFGERGALMRVPPSTACCSVTTTVDTGLDELPFVLEGVVCWIHMLVLCCVIV